MHDANTRRGKTVPEAVAIRPPGLRYTVFVTATVAIVSTIVLFSWLLDFWFLTSLGKNYIPVAPATAWLMLVLAGALLAFQVLKPRPLLRGLAWTGLGLISGISLLVLIQSLTGLEVSPEGWLWSAPARVGIHLIGRMSPLTAATFLLAVLAIALEAAPFNRRWISRQSAVVAGLATLMIGGAMLISYAAGAPFLYGNQFVPMALLTAALFTLIGSAVVVAAGPDTWPLNVFTSEISPSSPSQLFSKASLTAFLFLAAAIVTAGSAYLNNQLSAARAAVQKELSAIASLKMAQIGDWYQERQIDAEVVFRAPIIQQQALHYLRGAPGASTGRELQAWMEGQQTFNRYKRVVLFDRKGVPRLWSPAGVRPSDGTGHKDFKAALNYPGVLTTDLHRDAEADIDLDIWIPIGASPGKPAAGLLLIEVDPHTVLYPLIQSWPVPSASAETLVVRREGDQIVYLNELRHLKNSALSLRLPLGRQPYLPVALALQGVEGVIEGWDYRNVPVLAVARKIKGTPWVLVAKVDRQEIYAPLRMRVWLTCVGMLVLVLMATMGIRLLLQRQGRYWLQQQLASEQRSNRVLAHSNRLYTVLSKVNRMIVQADDRQLLFDEVCRIMVEAGGFRMACIGMMGGGERGHLAAAHADQDSASPPCLSVGAGGDCCFASTVITGEVPIVCNRIESDQALAGWRRSALERGYHSLAAAPIRLEDNRLAALTIYSSEPDFFSPEEIKLLEEVCADIGYALQSIEQKRLKEETEQSFKQMQIQVIQQDKLASIGQLAAGVAHEINNPIGFISSNLGSLAKYLDRYDAYIALLEETVRNHCAGQVREEAVAGFNRLKVNRVRSDIRQLINESIEGTDRVKNIVLDLKTFSRTEGAVKGPTDLNHCLDSTINIIWNEIKYVATLTRDYGDIPPVCCNSQQISQVLMNLLVNAAHAIEKQGEITVRTCSSPEAVFVSVSDTGSGIPPEHLGHIFEAFYTTKEPGKGTGLGLSISSEIVRKHGGEILVASELGRGTTFTVRLPIGGNGTDPAEQ